MNYDYDPDGKCLYICKECKESFREDEFHIGSALCDDCYYNMDQDEDTLIDQRV